MDEEKRTSLDKELSEAMLRLVSNVIRKREEQLDNELAADDDFGSLIGGLITYASNSDSQDILGNDPKSDPLIRAEIIKLLKRGYFVGHPRIGEKYNKIMGALRNRKSL